MKNYEIIFKFILALTLMIGPTAPHIAVAKIHKPTLAQIEIAKKSEAAKKKLADEANKVLIEAQLNLKQLIIIANIAQAKYISAKKELSVAKTQATAAAIVSAEAALAVSETHREIGKLAINAYVSGGGLTDFEAILSSSGPQEMIDRLSSLENLGANNKSSLRRFKAAEVVASQTKAAADLAKGKQIAVTLRVSAAKKEADDAKTEQAKEVAKLQAVQDQLQRDLASAKKVRITLEQQRQLAILEELRSIEASKVKGQAKIWTTGGPNGKSTSRTTQAQRLKAVEFAKKQVLANKPYVWGDEGPNSFDCSGLVYAAYKYAGLGWPNWDRLNSGLYYTYTKQIPLSEIQPGDLLFYSYKGTVSTIHHMSIYAGDGMVWEARSTKTGLRYSDMYSVEGMMPFAGRV